MYLELYVAHLKGIISIQRRTFSKEQHLAFSKEQNFPLQRRTFNANTITAILSWRAPYSSEGSLFKVCPRLNLIFNVYSSIISLQRRTFSKEQHLALRNNISPFKGEPSRQIRLRQVEARRHASRSKFRACWGLLSN